MRVAFVTQAFGPAGGGQERSTHALAQALSQRGHEIHVITRKIRGTVTDLPIVLHHLPIDSRNPTAFANEAERVLARLSCDIVHDMGDGWGGDLLQYHGGPYPLLAEHKLALLPPLLRRAKKLLLKLLPSYRLRYRFAAEQVRRHPGLFVALSRRQCAFLRWLYDLPESRIRVVYNGVDVARFSPSVRGRHREPIREALGIDSETTLFLLAAYNLRLKGVSVLLRAGEILARKGMKFHIAVLGGKARPAPPNAKSSRMRKSWVTFIGPVEDPRPYYAAADVYVHPTLYDSCSLSVLEAIASGLPVITTVQNGASELLHNGRDGFVLDNPCDAEALAYHMECLTEPSLRDEMGQAARETALQHRFEDNVAQILNLYTECLATRRQAA